MLTLSATLLAAQRQPTPPAPSARLVVRDLWNRWAPLHNGGEANDRQSAACWHASTGTVVRARIDGSGNLQTQVVGDLASEAAWETWTTRQTGVYAGDVAISDNGSTLCCFYLRQEGGGTPYTWRVKAIASADGGHTWGGETEVETATHADPYGGLASPGHDAVVLQRPDGTLRLRVFSGGSWTLPADGDWANSPTQGYGVATIGDPAGDLWALVAGRFDGSNRLRLASYLEGDGWALTAELAPGGTSQADFIARWPTMAFHAAANAYAFGWIEDVHAGGLDSATLVLTGATLNLSHPGPRVSPNVAVHQATPRRVNLVYDTEAGRWLACGEVGIHAAYAWGETVTRKNLTLDGVTRYRLTESPDGQTLELDVLDAGRALVGWGTGSDGKNALRPLAMLTLERGYHTAAGAERAAAPPLFLIHAGYAREGDGERFRLVAAGPRRLLELWRAPHALEATNISVGLLARHLLYHVGPWTLAWEDGTNAKWNTVLASYTLPPGTKLLGAITDLLALIGARLRWRTLSGYPYGQWEGVIWSDSPGGSVYDYGWAAAEDGARHPVFGQYIARGGPLDTQVRAFGPGAGINASNAGGSETLGRDVYAFATTRHLDTAGELAGLAAGLLQAGGAHAATGYLLAHPNVGLEVGDVVSIYDDSLGDDPITRRIGGISETYDAAKGTFAQRLLLEAL